jgi:hypothetical protein
MFHRVQPVFYAFDLLWLDGCSNASAGCGLWVPRRASRLLYVDHVGSRRNDSVCATALGLFPR